MKFKRWKKSKAKKSNKTILISFSKYFRFPRMSIIYKKCDEYSFDLIPFDTQTMFRAAQKCKLF